MSKYRIVENGYVFKIQKIKWMLGMIPYWGAAGHKYFVVEDYYDSYGSAKDVMNKMKEMDKKLYSKFKSVKE